VNFGWKLRGLTGLQVQMRSIDSEPIIGWKELNREGMVKSPKRVLSLTSCYVDDRYRVALEPAN